MLLRDVLNHAVKLYPNKVAFIDGDVRLPMPNERPHRRLAQGLLDLGLKPGDNIAILAEQLSPLLRDYFVSRRRRACRWRR